MPTETEKTVRAAGKDIARGLSNGEPSAVVGGTVKAATTPVAVVKDVVKAFWRW